MGKGKPPRKRKAPARNASREEEREPLTEPKGDLVPPGRRAPTAVGAETVPLPPREPPLPQSEHIRERPRPILWRLLRTLRSTVAAMLDVADAAAAALAKQLRG
jgi:hypothetical protein